MRWLKATWLLVAGAASLLGCGGGTGAQPGPGAGGQSDAGVGTGGTGGAGPGTGTGGTFEVAPHAAQPQVSYQGGPVLSAPKVLPIFYAGDSDAANVQAFLQELGGSSYWGATTSEYGVGPLAALPSVTLTSVAASIDDVTLQSVVASNTSGPAPAWGAADPSVIYLFALPAGTVATQQGAVCCTDFGGYHDETVVGGMPISYAVICVCPDFFGPGWAPLDERTVAMSHELIESATDPFPRSEPAFRDADQPDFAWTLVTHGELADMCVLAPDTFYLPPGSSNVVQRSWSNAAAAAGNNPCVPAPKGVPYFNVSPVLDTIPLGSSGDETQGVQISVGQSRTVDLDLFSVGSIPLGWNVRAYAYEEFFGGGSPSLSFSFDKAVGRNGDILRLTINALATNPQLGVDPFIIMSTYGTSGNSNYQTNVAIGLVTN